MGNEIEVFKAALASRESEFVSVIGDEAKWRRFCTTAVVLVGKNPKWLDGQHDRASLFQACMHAAESGLSLDPNLGHVYFVPRWNKHTKKNSICFQLGYKGLLKLAYQSGTVESFSAECVFKGDEFAYELGTKGFVNHRPAFKSKELTHVWAMAKMKSGGEVFVVIPKEEVDKAKAMSQSDHIWTQFYQDMAKKTALRRLCKLLHLCVELQRAIGVEDQYDGEFSRASRPHNALESLSELARAKQAVGGTAESASHPLSQAASGGAKNESIADTVNSGVTPPDDLSFNEDLIPQEDER